MLDANSTMIELIVHLNLILIYTRTEEPELAAAHLEQADILFGKCNQRQRQLIQFYRGIRALLLCTQGQTLLAVEELKKAQGPENPLYLLVQAKLELANGDFASRLACAKKSW